MAGNVFLKEASVVVLQNDNGTSVANTAAGTVGTTLDNRSGGNGGENFWANFELKAGFGSSPTVGLTVDLYLVPSLDGTNSADVDLTTPLLPQSCYVGSFAIVKSQTAVQRLVLMGVPLMPLLYTAYVVNNAGFTMSTNWGLRVVTSQEQYS